MKIFLFLIYLFPFITWGQLPKPSVLAENDIKSVEIWKHFLRPLVEGEKSPEKNQEIREYKRLIKKKEQLSTWFFNAEGFPDSCWIIYPNEKKTFIYQYDQNKRVVFFQENKNDKMITRQKVETQENGNIHCLYWSEKTNDWSVNYILAKDSLFIRTKNVSDSTAYYFDDRSTGIIERTRFVDGKILFRYSERWTTTENGNPDSLIITFDQYDNIQKKKWKSDSFVHAFKLNEDGSVIPAHGEVHHNLNFYKRGNKKTPFDEKKPFHDPVNNFLHADELILKSDTIIERTFSNVHPQHYVEYKYTKY